MEIPVLIGYGLLLAFHIWMLVRTLRKRNTASWVCHLLLELISVIGAVGIAFFFDGLRGSGMMPGMSYIMEFFYSLIAAAVYAVMLLVSLIAMFVRKITAK